jgi:hypothetical protein
MTAIRGSTTSGLQSHVRVTAYRRVAVILATSWLTLRLLPVTMWKFAPCSRGRKVVDPASGIRPFHCWSSPLVAVGCSVAPHEG